ncbi:MAG: ParA family protein [Hydrogenophaga sp.]|uniref:ParA family protein n=1 Tax=Hydrogenophaga sp. TaxID=1904254 RepID=UPI002AB9F941|nr:ParA family protein [Hydrogenophaga sp.]MDZ4101006.1 ParA family protein [Hydrogenophaga sp.]MDZ4239502.1 ParA family protein [Hydrogenophaga sp.]
MPIIAVMNSKGGSGKSTLATQIAAWYASQGTGVILGDSDRQRSASGWLSRRAPSAATVIAWPNDQGRSYRAPGGATHIIVDTPGGLHGLDLAKQLTKIDAVIMPVGPSVFDMDTSVEFLQELRKHPRVANGRCQVCMVGMRWPLDVLRAWQGSSLASPLPLLTVIEEATVYRACLASGGSVFDTLTTSATARAELLQWQPLLDWLNLLPDADQRQNLLVPTHTDTAGVLRVLPHRPSVHAVAAPVPGQVPRQHLKSPEAFSETVPPVGTSTADLLAARSQIKARLGHTPGPAGTLAVQPVRLRLAAHREAPGREANPKTSNVPASSSGWLSRLFGKR